MTNTHTQPPVPFGTIVRYHGTASESHGDYIVAGYIQILPSDPGRGLVLAPVDSDGGIGRPDAYLSRVHVRSVTAYHPDAVRRIWPNGIGPHHVIPTPAP